MMKTVLFYKSDAISTSFFLRQVVCLLHFQTSFFLVFISFFTDLKIIPCCVAMPKMSMLPPPPPPHSQVDLDVQQTHVRTVHMGILLVEGGFPESLQNRGCFGISISWLLCLLGSVGNQPLTSLFVFDVNGTIL